MLSFEAIVYRFLNNGDIGVRWFDNCKKSECVGSDL